MRICGCAALLIGLSLVSTPLAAQCLLTSTPVQFEPFPPGAVRPLYGAPAGQLSPGFSNSLSLYRNGGAGPQRLLMIETFGYSTLDLTNPANPFALRYDDMRFDATPVAAHGDGQNYIQTIGVSSDGQRSVFSVVGPAEPDWHTLAGRPDGAEGFGTYGDFGMSRSLGTVVQQIGGRYIAYAVFPTANAIASDVTSLPGARTSLNVASETTAFPPGYSLSLAGNFLVYVSGTQIQIVDASSPGPAGRITSGYRQTAITSALFGRTPTAYAAATDPLDANKLWILVEFAPAPGVENSPSYGLASVTRDGGGNLSAPVSAGPLFRVPSQPGETWLQSGNSASLVASNGSLFVLMWATRSVPSQEFVLYSTTTAGWGLGYPQIVSASGFGLAATRAAALAGGGNSVYVYLPTGPRAYVVPLTCFPVNAPAASGLSVTNAGVPLQSGDTAFVGDTLTVVPSVAPPPAFQALTDWRFDFDFHAGAPSEDAGSLPRIKNRDNGALGNPATPPQQVTYVGPCDPQNGGDPASGSGCWASLKTNGAVGGPDYGADPQVAGSQKALSLALEATNANGSANTAVFTVNWRIPAARLQSAQVFVGQPLVSASDGHPAATGYKWWFGASPATLARASCNGPTCVPTLDTAGVHYYWLAATYPNGYATPDWDGATALPYTVTDFSPRFAVNGSATGPASATLGMNLSVSNSSLRANGVTATYQYSFCLAPCADSFQAWPAMADPPVLTGSPPTYANILVPSNGTPGTWALRIRVSYTGGTTYWPDPAPNGAAYPVTVTNVTPEMHIFVNGLDPCGFVGCIVNRVNARVGDALTAYSYITQSGALDTTFTTLHWDFPGATPVSGDGNGVAFTYAAPGTYDLVLTRNGIPYSFPGAAVIAPRPLAAAAAATPNPSPQYLPVLMTCTASWGTGVYTGYTWAFGDGQTGSGASVSHNYLSAGSFQATCRATDSGGATATSPAVSVSVTPNPLTAAASVSPASVMAGTGAPFSCAAAGGLPPYTYSWTFSDGWTATGPNVTHAFSSAGPQSGTCTAVDALGNQQASAAPLNVLALPTSFSTLSPCRVVDTRLAAGPLGGPALQAAGTADRSFALAGACGVPADAKSVSANLTVTNVRATGTLSLYPGDRARTGTTSLAFTAGKTRANNSIVVLSGDGSGTIKVQNISSGAVDLIVDVNGYFR